MIDTWNCRLPCGTASEELVVSFDERRERRLLVLPALFDEANKLRRTTVELMRKLDAQGLDSFLPDLPGMNESLVPLEGLTLSDWRETATLAASQFEATHVLAIRGGALLTPAGLPAWHYAPQSGPKLLRAMLRAQVISAREAGADQSMESLQQTGREHGLELAGWPIGPKLFSELETAEPFGGSDVEIIEQSRIGGAGIWLRAEPDENPDQIEALAAIIAGDLSAPERGS